MRYNRNTFAASAIATALLLSGTAAAGVAQAKPAQPDSLYAPSSLVLTVGKGADAATATVERAVTLECAPRPGGSHPSPRSACTDLAAINGQFAQLVASSSQKPCTRQWDPVVITAAGVWEGKRVTWSITFGNACEMAGSMAENSVFAF
ncbi:subtilase-type protease inhibitor [Streptomyces sp. NBC_01142]|uniref:subtilase-type protease inhibitor n=1 Tax=Streptomyces sp. NBC_01142 TaxID=2975865 RepID=UPI0022535DBC|nr:subtilase-type protease inhibitor [Streptomyces sp. NBC_01142]MCX4823874.1 subtilase-type protease inhibitor [Streptomyces sp. NBC_01142]